MSRLLAAFYGDDFTGSVDAMLQFTRQGLRVRLFVGLPGDKDLAAAADRFDVVGIAGIARSLPTEAMAAELTPVLRALRALEPRVIQYKACSTADSSPEIGSLGRVIELGREIVGEQTVPVLIAQPDFGRYTVFGNHFASENGTVHRLDRQPTMSAHPSTPMHESDLALHIGAQTPAPIGRVLLTEYAGAQRLTDRLVGSGDAAIVLDALADEHLALIGEAVLGLPEPVFAVGSGGLSTALGLGARSASADAAPVVPAQEGLREPGPALAVSGSRSSRTRRQLEAAADAGWAVFPLELSSGDVHREQAARVVELLASGRSVALSAHDAATDGIETGEVLPAIAAAASGIVSAAVSASATGRVLVLGGDTSSRVIQALGVQSLSIAANPWSNVVLLAAHAPGRPVDGIELLLKGGQVGDDDLLEQVRMLGASRAGGEDDDGGRGEER